MSQNNRKIIQDWISSVHSLVEDLDSYKHSMESWEQIRDRTSDEHDSEDLKEEVDAAWSALHDSVQELCAPAKYGGKSKQKKTRKQKRKNNRK